MMSGLLKPNGFGLYDIVGVAREMVFKRINGTVVLMYKGANTQSTLDELEPGYTYVWNSSWTGKIPAGLRLVRKISE